MTIMNTYATPSLETLQQDAKAIHQETEERMEAADQALLAGEIQNPERCDIYKKCFRARNDASYAVWVALNAS